MADPKLQTKMSKKVDITDKVVGKLNGERMTLYLNNRVIGNMHLEPERDPRFEFNDGYGIEGDRRIYQVQEQGQQKEYYVEGCDLGWC
jgi:hypothetical protein